MINSTLSLAGLNILICRPPRQTQELTSALIEVGAKIRLLPVIDILPVDSDALVTAIKQQATPDILIFTSANAVIPAKTASLEAGLNWPPTSILIAIGEATANKLKAEDCPEVYFPAMMSSEGLLDYSLLQQVEDKSISIFGGADPRPLLQQTLCERGARVNYITCYKRLFIQHNLSYKQQEALLNQTDVFIITSVEILQGLIKNFDQSLLHVLWDKVFLIINPRLLEALNAQGYTKLPIIADNPSNTSIIKALTSWYKDQNL